MLKYFIFCLLPKLQEQGLANEASTSRLNTALGTGGRELLPAQPKPTGTFICQLVYFLSEGMFLNPSVTSLIHLTRHIPLKTREKN